MYSVSFQEGSIQQIHTVKYLKMPHLTNQIKSVEEVSVFAFILKKKKYNNNKKASTYILLKNPIK